MTSRRVFLKNGAFALVSLGFAPSFLSRTAFAQGRSVRAKRLIAIFQRGAVDGLSVVVPYGEADYYRARPSIAIPRPNGGERRGHRSRRLLRLQPAAGAARAAVSRARPRRRARVRLARQHALALRRAGLHGDGDARREEHGGRLAEPVPAGAQATGSRRRSAPSRCRPQLPRMLEGAAPALAVRDLAQFGVHAGPASDRMSAAFEREYAAAGRRRAERHRARGLRGDADAEGGRPVEVPAGARRRLPAQSVRAGAEADRAAHQGGRRPRGRVRRRRRLGHAREPGRRAGSARRAASTTSRAASPRSSPTSATAWRTRSC